MKYKYLENTYKADVLATAMHSREVEFFHYDLDIKNFEHMIDTAPAGSDLTDLRKRLADTRVQMAIVESSYNALESQIEDAKTHAEAVTRTALKRKALEEAPAK